MRIAVGIIAAAVVVAACGRGQEYESAGTVDSLRDTTRDTISGLNIDFGTTRDTINIPILGTEKDTIIVDKPVVKGRKPVEVKRPTVDVNKKP